jgi:DNA topoisomerase IB
VVRLRRTSPDRPGWTRRRAGRGFSYLDADGRRITDPDQLQRIRDLAIPPAWQDVWITPHVNGHLQAVGTDDAGRRQYLYHPEWRRQRDRDKHEHMLLFARRLPGARRQVSEDLARTGMPRERALAAAFRLLDVGLFRIGGEVYAEENGSFGLATLRRDQVRVSAGTVRFEYVAKSGQQRRLAVEDPEIGAVVSTLKRRRDGGEELLAFRTGDGWRDVGSADINAYLKDVIGPAASAKDFRTWHATVLAAVALARLEAPGSPTAARRAVSGAVREVAAQLGNTPAVCRSSYIDPRVIDRFGEGRTIGAALRRIEPGSPGGVRADFGQDRVRGVVEKAVLRLLTE